MRLTVSSAGAAVFCVLWWLRRSTAPPTADVPSAGRGLAPEAAAPLPPTSNRSARRSAEKRRTSSCAFADAVAEAVIKAYRRHCPAELVAAYRQTVLAGFVLLDRASGELRVVGLGVGTKFVQGDSVEVGSVTPCPRSFRHLWPGPNGPLDPGPGP